MTRSPWGPALVGAVVLAAAAEAAYVLWRPTWGADSARYETSPDGALGVLIAGLVAGAAGALVFGPYRGRIAFLGLLATALLLCGLLAIFSVGLLLLLGALPVLVALGRAMRDGAGDLARMAAGAALAASLLVLTLALTRPPTVECLPRGAGARASPTHWWGGGPSSGSGESAVSADGRVASGTIRVDGATITYACGDSRLTEFRRDPG